MPVLPRRLGQGRQHRGPVARLGQIDIAAEERVGVGADGLAGDPLVATEVPVPEDARVAVEVDDLGVQPVVGRVAVGGRLRTHCPGH